MWLDHCVIFKNQTKTCVHPEATVLLSSYKRIAIITVQKGHWNYSILSTGLLDGKAGGHKNTVILLLIRV